MFELANVRLGCDARRVYRGLLGRVVLARSTRFTDAQSGLLAGDADPSSTLSRDSGVSWNDDREGVYRARNIR